MCNKTYQSRIENLSVSIGNKQILSDISFPLCNGITGIIGKNGAGKTTLLKAILGILPRTTGKVIISGKELKDSAKSRAAHFSYVPQSGVTDLHITGLEFALLSRASHLKILEIPSAKDRVLAEKAFERLNASYLSNRYFDSLSGGERKLCYLAKAICAEAETALFDEPCADLDFGKQNEFMELLKSGLFKKVLITVHSPVLAMQYCDRIIVLDGGKISDMIEMNGSEESFERYLNALKTLYGEKVAFSESCNQKNIIWTL